jgi:pimeloyl-ACP methyl ester carboxylesterase
VTRVLANGIEQHVQQMGAAAGDVPTAVCIHGIGTDSLASYYFTLAKPLADAGMRVVMYDLRGHGRSSRPPSGYTLDDYVADLTALLDHLGVTGPVYLVGNSFGGTIAFSFAVRHPARAAGIAVLESEPATRAWAEKMAANLTKASTELARGEALAWITVRYGRHTTKLAKSAARMLHSTTLVADIPASAVPTDDELRALDCPVLAIYGEDSDLAVQAGPLEALLPRCTTVLVPGQDHSVLVNVPDTVLGLFLPWLDSCARSGAVA